MARKTLIDLNTEINTLLADNNTGAISALDMRTLLADLRDTIFRVHDVTGIGPPAATQDSLGTIYIDSEIPRIWYPHVIVRGSTAAQGNFVGYTTSEFIGAYGGHIAAGGAGIGINQVYYNYSDHHYYRLEDRGTYRQFVSHAFHDIFANDFVWLGDATSPEEAVARIDPFDATRTYLAFTGSNVERLDNSSYVSPTDREEFYEYEILGGPGGVGLTASEVQNLITTMIANLVGTPTINGRTLTFTASDGTTTDIILPSDGSMADGVVESGSIDSTTRRLDLLTSEGNTVQIDLSILAALASPTFTGVPRAPTANITLGSSVSTQIATHAFVRNYLNRGVYAASDTYYARGNMVTHNGSLWLCIAIGIANLEPTDVNSSSWLRLTGLQHADQVQALIDTAIANLIDSAPGALNTLNELAAALGDDPNFAATLTAAIAGRLVAAQNLADLSDAAVARANLGANDLIPYKLGNIYRAFAEGEVVVKPDNTEGTVSVAGVAVAPVGWRLTRPEATAALPFVYDCHVYGYVTNGVFGVQYGTPNRTDRYIPPGGTGIDAATANNLIQVALAAAVSGNTETGITVTHNLDGTLDFIVMGGTPTPTPSDDIYFGISPDDIPEPGEATIAGIAGRGTIPVYVGVRHQLIYQLDSENDITSAVRSDDSTASNLLAGFTKYVNTVIPTGETEPFSVWVTNQALSNPAPFDWIVS